MLNKTVRQTKKSKNLSLRKKSVPPKHSINEFIKLFFLNSISVSLFLVFLKNGWSPLSFSQIQIQGNNNFDKQKIIKGSGLKLPKPLLEIIPKRIETNLIKKLSLQAVSVRRQILPTKLIIELLEREPIAYAERIGSKGIEIGMLDKDAEWIPIEWSVKDRPEIQLHVSGWNENYQDLIAFIIQKKQNLGSPLKNIKVSPTGEIVLQTEYFPSINLGSNPEQLEDQIKVLGHLSKTLPSSFIKQKGTTIDLRDLRKPELQTGSVN